VTRRVARVGGGAEIARPDNAAPYSKGGQYWTSQDWTNGQRFNSLIVQHVRFFLGPTDVQAVAICLIWCRDVQSRDVSPHNFDGLAMSGLAFSVAPCRTARRDTLVTTSATGVTRTTRVLRRFHSVD